MDERGATPGHLQRLLRRAGRVVRAAACAVLVLCGAGGARADEPVEVELEVGGTFNVCKARLVICPASTFMCDDPKVAVVEHGAEGAEVKGISPGKTLCSVLGHAAATRIVLRVTVKRPEPRDPGATTR